MPKEISKNTVESVENEIKETQQKNDSLKEKTTDSELAKVPSITSSEIIDNAARKPEEIKEAKELLLTYQELLNDCKNQLADVNKALKSIPSARRKLKVIPLEDQLSEIDRLELKVKKAGLKNQLDVLKELIFNQKRIYKSLTGQAIKKFKNDQELNKANFKWFYARNKHLFNKTLLKFLNNIKDEYPEKMVELRTEAKDNSEIAAIKFNAILENCMREVDKKAFVLLGGRFKNYYYQTAKETISNLAVDPKGKIEQLVLPEGQQVDEIN